MCRHFFFQMHRIPYCRLPPCQTSTRKAFLQPGSFAMVQRKEIKAFVRRELYKIERVRNVSFRYRTGVGVKNTAGEDKKALMFVSSFLDREDKGEAAKQLSSRVKIWHIGDKKWGVGVNLSFRCHYEFLVPRSLLEGFKTVQD